jgi:hypothetical protein
MLLVCSPQGAVGMGCMHGSVPNVLLCGTHLPAPGLAAVIGPGPGLCLWVSARPLSFMPCSCPPVMTRCCGRIVALLCVDQTHSVHASCAAHCCTPTCWLLFCCRVCVCSAALLHHPTYTTACGHEPACAIHTLCGRTDPVSAQSLSVVTPFLVSEMPRYASQLPTQVRTKHTCSGVLNACDQTLCCF